MASQMPAPRLEGKVIHYNSNGSGRDSYIWKSSGGMFKCESEKPKGFQIGTFGEKKHYRPVNNYLPAKHVHYRADGTGRDVYINVDEGGLSQNSWKRSNYLNGLRGYEKIRFASDQDYLQKLQFVRPSTAAQTKATQEHSRNQFRMTQRLSQPKFFEDPYKSSTTRSSTALPGLRTIY